MKNVMHSLKGICATPCTKWNHAGNCKEETIDNIIVESGMVVAQG